jgi:Myo-inositol oxygenase
LGAFFLGGRPTRLFNGVRLCTTQANTLPAGFATRKEFDGSGYLSDEALYMLRFHSFYAWHRHGAYQYLENEKDREMLGWVKKFNPYDLYSKGHSKPDLKHLKPYYDDPSSSSCRKRFAGSPRF